MIRFFRTTLLVAAAALPMLALPGCATDSMNKSSMEEVCPACGGKGCPKCEAKVCEACGGKGCPKCEKQ